MRACLVSPSKTRQATFWAHPKVESPQTDAWRVALGKGDLMQKEELEKTKNWLVGDEKGVKLRASQRAELNIEVSPKTAKFEKFVFPPIFKNCLLTFL